MILPFIQSGIRLSQIERPNAWQRYDIRRKTINSRLWFYAAEPYDAHLLPHSFLLRLRFFIMVLFSTDYILICILFQCYEILFAGTKLSFAGSILWFGASILSFAAGKQWTVQLVGNAHWDFWPDFMLLCPYCFDRPYKRERHTASTMKIA